MAKVVPISSQTQWTPEACLHNALEELDGIKGIAVVYLKEDNTFGGLSTSRLEIRDALFILEMAKSEILEGALYGF